jgi:DNA-binding MarR family transcriptional regulator
MAPSVPARSKRRPTPALRKAGPLARQHKLGGVLEFMQELWALSHGLDAVSKRMGRELGVTGPQRLVIRLVGRFPGISAGDLARLMHTHPSTLTGVLGRLEARGLLHRVSDPLDARRLLFRLTVRGRRIDRLRAGTVEAAVAGTLSAAEPREARAASKLLGRLAASLVRAAEAPERRSARR